MRRIFLDPNGTPRPGWRILAMVLLLVVVMLAVNVGWKALGLPGPDGGGAWHFLAFAALLAGGTLAGIRLLLRVFERRGLAAIGLPLKAGALRVTALGIALGAVPVLLVLGASLAGGYGAVRSAGPGWQLLVTAGMPMLAAGFLLAAWEELVLRGYLLRQLELGLGGGAAAAITGILFGLLHGANPGANWEGLLYTALGGVLMAVLMLRSRSLWLLIGYHFGWNATASALLGLELSGFEEEVSVFVTTLAGPDWLTGGSYGFEASLPALVAEAVTLAVAIRLAGRLDSPESKGPGKTGELSVAAPSPRHASAS